MPFLGAVPVKWPSSAVPGAHLVVFAACALVRLRYCIYLPPPLVVDPVARKMSGGEKAASMAGNMSDKAVMLDAMATGELAGLLGLTSPALRAALLQVLTAAVSDGGRAQLMSSTYVTPDERADREAAEAAAAQATTDAEDGAADTQAAAGQRVTTRSSIRQHNWQPLSMWPD